MAENDDLWVFGYGSLMWRPGFPYRERQAALLRGYHRALCVQSIVYRGSRENPGLVVGLDGGGSCKGRSFLVAGGDREEVLAYLDHREMRNDVYCSRWLPVTLADGRRVKAYAFVANHRSPQYLGRITDAEAVRFLVRGAGQEGRALDYLRNTVAHLDELGIGEGHLHRILAAAERADHAGASGAVALGRGAA